MSTERMTDEEVAEWHEAMRFASPPADASPVDRVLQDHLRARREEIQKDDRIRALEVQRAAMLCQLSELREMESHMSRLSVEREETIKALADMLEGLWGLRDTSKTGLWRIDLDDEEAAKVHAALRRVGRIK